MLFYMNWKKSAALIGLIMLAASAFAIELRLPGDNETMVTETRDIDGDYLFWGKILEFSGSAEDVQFYGESVKFTGAVKGDMIAGGKEISLEGPIGNDLKAAGERVTVNGTVGDTSFLAGKTIIIGPDAIIDGDVFVGGSEVTLHGTINGDLRIGAGYVTIDGTVNGNVIVKTGELILTERARINGNLTYESEDSTVIQTGNKVTGTVIKTVFEEKRGICTPRVDEKKRGDGGFMIFMALSTIVSILGGGLLLLLIPAFGTIFTGNPGSRNFWSTLLWGLIPLFLYPVAVLLLLPLFPVSIALALAGLPLGSLATVLGITRFGEYMFEVFKWKKVNRFQFFLFGLVLLLIPFVIPGVSLLAFLFVTAAGWGLILRILGKKRVAVPVEA